MKRVIKRVLMTADAVGGVWTYCLELARGLEPYGVEVVLATMGPRPTPGQRRELPANVMLVESDHRLEWMPDAWDDVARAGEWLLDLETVHPPDVVHLNGYAHGALPFTAPSMIVAHSCVCSWFEAVRGVAPPPEWARYRFRVAKGLRNVGHVVAVSRAMLAALHRNYGWLPSVSVIHNGRDLVTRHAAKEPYVLGAGRVWDEAKNLLALERVADRLRWQVFLAGEAQPESPHRLGRLDSESLACWMARASVFAAPAKYEPFGLSVLEAALHGCALVLGDIPSLREVWADAAVFVPPSDDDALAAALHALIESAALRAELAERARSRAAWHSRKAMTDAYRALYAELAPEEVSCAS